MNVNNPASTPTARAFLLCAGLATIALWQIPTYGELILYPFTLLATYAHEMGHGLMAVALGARFESLEMFPDGSGLALWRGNLSRAGFALVAAGGLVGPSVAGATLLAFSRRPSRSRGILVVLGLLMIGSAIVAKSAFTLLFISASSVALIVVGLRFPSSGATFFLQLLGVQLCVALFRDVRYMFSSGGLVGGKSHGSDSAAMAEALFLPYWFWGGLTAVFSAFVLVWGLWIALRSPKPKKLRSRAHPSLPK